MTGQKDELAEKNKRVSGVAKQKYLAIMLRLCLHEINSFSIPYTKDTITNYREPIMYSQSIAEICAHTMHIFFQQGQRQQQIFNIVKINNIPFRKDSTSSQSHILTTSKPSRERFPNSQIKLIYLTKVFTNAKYQSHNVSRPPSVIIGQWDSLRQRKNVSRTQTTIEITKPPSGLVLSYMLQCHIFEQGRSR